MTQSQLERTDGATGEEVRLGRVSRVIGPVVDVEFPADQMPDIYNACWWTPPSTGRPGR